jgi:hypothetical protein
MKDSERFRKSIMLIFRKEINSLRVKLVKTTIPLEK